MKNLTKISAFLLFAVIVGFSSCIKTEISPEVTALRQAQVDKLRADINQVLANVSATYIQNRYEEMSLYFDSLNRVYQQTLQTAQLEQALLNIDNQVMLEKMRLEQNKLSYEQAAAAYEKFIAEGTFAANAATYLTNYNTTTAALLTLYTTRINKQKDLTLAQLLLSSAGSGNLTWDVWKTRLQAQRTDKAAELTAANAALTALQGVLDNPATIESTKAALTTQIADLADQNKALDVDVVEATNTLNTANTAVTDANTVIGNMATIEASITTKNAEIVAANATLATANAAVPPLSTALATANANLASTTSSLSAAQSAYNVKLAAYNTAFTAWNNAVNDVAAKLVLQTIAQNNYNADPTPANQTLLTAAQNAYNAAVAAEGPLNTAKNAANTALTDANNALVSATNNKNTAQTAANTAQTNLSAAQAAVVTAQTTVTTKNTDLAILVANKANIQTAYDSAVANLSALKIAANAANNAKNKVVADEAANTAMQTALNNVLTVLTTELTNITGAIATQKTAIQTIEDALAGLDKQIAQNAIDKTAAEANVTSIQAELAMINVKITEQEALVAYWKNLLDDAVAGL